MSQDLESKAATSRYFPQSFTEVVSCVADLQFSVHSYDSRLAVRFLNCDVECDLGHQLASFMRMSYLAVLSLPDGIPAVVAKSALSHSISEFAAIDKRPHLAVREQQFVVYRAYLGPLSRVTIAQHVVSAGSRSYLQFQRVAMLSRSQASPKQQVVLVQRAVA